MKNQAVTKLTKHFYAYDCRTRATGGPAMVYYDSFGRKILYSFDDLRKPPSYKEWDKMRFYVAGKIPVDCLDLVGLLKMHRAATKKYFKSRLEAKRTINLRTGEPLKESTIKARNSQKNVHLKDVRKISGCIRSWIDWSLKYHSFLYKCDRIKEHIRQIVADRKHAAESFERGIEFPGEDSKPLPPNVISLADWAWINKGIDRRRSAQRRV